MPQLGSVLKGLFANAGLVALPPIVLLEYAYGLNLFFPGALTILFAMSTTAGNPAHAFFTFAVIWAFSLVGCALSYRLGKLEAGENKKSALGNKYAGVFLAFLAYGHPLTASIRSFQRGADGVRPLQYLRELIPYNFLWNCFWGEVSYHYGGVIVEGNTFTLLLLAYSVYWFVQESQASL